MVQSFNIFNNYEIPEVSLCYPDRRKICDLSRVSNLSVDLKFNSLSEISFEIVSSADGIDTPYYDMVRQRNKIHISNLGWFTIQDIEEESDGVLRKKTVPASSEECFMSYRSVNLLEGTYQFYSAIPSDDTIVSKIMGYIPNWSIGTISSSLWNKYRTFDVTTDTLYSFIMNDVSDAYECFFVFDTENRVVNIYDSTDVLSSTSVILSFENLVKSISIESKSDEYVTALAVTGGGDLDISGVNPLGGTYIYDFSYPISQHLMSEELEAAVVEWQASVESHQTSFANKLTEYKTKNSEYIVLQSELTDLESDLTTIETLMQVDIDAGVEDLSGLNAELAAAQADIDSKQHEINTNRSEATALYDELQGIVSLLAIENNFSGDLYYELLDYIVESTYQNENIIQTSTMSLTEVQEAEQSLYDQGLSVLGQISQPRYTFSIDSANFVFLKEYLNFTEQLQTGSTMTIYIDDTHSFTPVLLEIKYNYESPTDFELTFGNRLKLDDDAYSYADLMEDSVSAGTTVGVNSSLWNSWSSTYESDVSAFIRGELDASKNELVSSSDAEITISSVGLRAKKKLEDGTYDPRQLWLTPRTLAFTTDNWDTVATAIGRITLPDSSEAYGVVGDVIIGSIVASESLTIQNTNNTFIVDGDGATLTDATFTVDTSNGNAKIIIDPTDGFKIQKNEDGTFVDKIYLDSSGNATFDGKIIAASGTIGGFSISESSISSSAEDDDGAIIQLNSDGTCRIGALTITESSGIYTAEFSGKLTATSGTIGGWTISSTGLTSSYGDYIKSNGTGKLGLLTYTSSSAVFTGNVYANNISTGTTEGYITGSQIGSSTITGSNMERAYSTLKADMATINNLMIGIGAADFFQTKYLSVARPIGGSSYQVTQWRTVTIDGTSHTFLGV